MRIRLNGRRKQFGFTFIELFAATAICAILMVAVTGVIGAIGKPIDTAESGPGFNVLDLAGEQLQWDLAHARYAKFNNNRLTLYGYMGLDSETLTPCHRPTQVKYLFESTGTQNWLIREQTTLDSLETDRTSRQLLLTGVDQILIQVLKQPELVVLVEDDVFDNTDKTGCSGEDCEEESDENTEDTEISEEQGDLEEDEETLLAETDEELSEEEDEPIEIEWFDLEHNRNWFLPPDVIKFVFIPNEVAQQQEAYDGLDWMVVERSTDEPTYPQKVIILR